MPGSPPLESQSRPERASDHGLATKQAGIQHCNVENSIGAVALPLDVHSPLHDHPLVTRLRLEGYTYGGKRYTLDDIRQLCHGLRIVYLFSGGYRDADFQHWCQLLGGEASLVDLQRDPSHDMLDEHSWRRIASTLDQHDGGLFSPPCNTFPRARSG